MPVYAKRVMGNFCPTGDTLRELPGGNVANNAESFRRKCYRGGSVVDVIIARDMPHHTAQHTHNSVLRAGGKSLL